MNIATNANCPTDQTRPVALIRSSAKPAAQERCANAQGIDFAQVVRIVPSPDHSLVGFSALRGFLTHAIDDLERLKSDLLPTLATELIWLFPSLQPRSWAKNALDLDEIALPPSRRRLHKESEIVQRVIFALVRLVRGWARVRRKTTDSNSKQGPLLLHFIALDQMDEQSIRLFRTLADTDLESEISLLASMSPIPCSTPDQETSTAKGTQGSLAGFADVAGLRDRMVSDLLTLTAPVQITVQKTGEGVKQAADAAVLDLPKDALALGTEEVQCYAAFRKVLDAGEADNAVDLGKAACAAVASSVFTLNFPLALDVVAELGTGVDALSQDDQYELALQLAFAHAFSTDFEMARAALEHSVKFATQPRQIAVAHFHLALVHIKRLKSPAEGRAHIDTALGLLDPSSVPDANEMAWLQNLRALSFVEQRNFAGAGPCLKAAIQHNASVPRSSDQVHLKLNLLNNISLLEEITGDYARAIKRYASLEPIMAGASPNAAKHWHYRLGGLLVRNGDLKSGLAHLVAADRNARVSEDLFYCARISADIAAVHLALDDEDATARWQSRTNLLQAMLDGCKDGAFPLDIDGSSFIGTAITQSTDLTSPRSGLLSAEAPPTSPAKVKTRLNQPFDRINLYQSKAA